MNTICFVSLLNLETFGTPIFQDTYCGGGQLPLYLSFLSDDVGYGHSHSK